MTDPLTPKPSPNRQQLGTVFKDPETREQMEALFRQANNDIPAEIAVVEAIANAANATANSANATANIANGTANTANATANAALSEADALTLPQYFVAIADGIIPNAIVLDAAEIATLLGYVPAPTNNPLFTGQVSVDDTSFYLTLATGTAYLNFDVNDYLSYDRSGNELHVIIGGAGVASFSATGAILFGTPSASTAAPGTATDQLATTAFVAASVAAGVVSFNTRTGAITLTSGDVTTALGFAPQPTNNPTFTGQLSVDDAQFYLTISAGSAYLNFDTNDYLSYDRSANELHVVIGTTGVATFAAAGVVLLGVPTAATASPGTNTGQIATTAFVTAAVAAVTTGVSSFNTRTGAVTLTSGDVTGALTYTPLNKAGDTMGGQLNIEDSAYFLHISSSNPTVNFDTNDYLQYDRSGNILKGVIGTTSIFSASATALRAELKLEVVDADFYQTVSGGDAIINFDSTDYISYTRASNSLNVIIGGSGVVAVNPAGMKVTGVTETDTLRVNQTPTATATPSDYSIPVNINGATYYMRLSSTP